MFGSTTFALANLDSTVPRAAAEDTLDSASTFTVEDATTHAQIVEAMAKPEITTIHFTVDKTFDKGFAIEPVAGRTAPLTFLVDEGKAFTINAATGAGLTVNTAFKFTNKGTVTITNVQGRGIKVAQGTPGEEVVFEGSGADTSSYNLGPSGKYASLEAERLNGPLTVANTTMTLAPGDTAVEPPVMISAQVSGGNLVLFEDAVVNLEETNKKPAMKNALYTEQPMKFLRSTLNSSTAVYYNLVTTTLAEYADDATKHADLVFEDSTANLTTVEGAATFFHPFVSVNTNNNTVTIKNSTVSSDIKAAGSAFGPHRDFEFQDASYIVDNSVVKGGALGVDRDNKGQNTLTVTGDSQLDIPTTDGDAGTPMPDVIDVVIDGGTVDLPKFSEGHTAHNSLGQDLKEFISDPAVATDAKLSINKLQDEAADYSYDYLVSESNEDGKKHVWAPTVTVEYYWDKEDTQPFAQREIIAGGGIDNPFGDNDPVGKTGKGDYHVFSPEDFAGSKPDEFPVFIEKAVPGENLESTVVSQDLKVELQEPPADPTTVTETPDSVTTTETPQGSSDDDLIGVGVGVGVGAGLAGLLIGGAVAHQGGSSKPVPQAPAVPPAPTPTVTPTMTPTVTPTVTTSAKPASTPAKAPQSQATLAKTGANVTAILGLGILLLVAGAGVIAAMRRRKES